MCSRLIISNQETEHSCNRMGVQFLFSVTIVIAVVIVCCTPHNKAKQDVEHMINPFQIKPLG
jgi:hypothetical protein